MANLLVGELAVIRNEIFRPESDGVLDMHIR